MNKYLTLVGYCWVFAHIHKHTQAVITTNGLIIRCWLKRWRDTCFSRPTAVSESHWWLFHSVFFLPHLKLCANVWRWSTGASYHVSNLIINSRCLVHTRQWVRSGSGHRKKGQRLLWITLMLQSYSLSCDLRSVTLLERSVTDGRGSNTGDSWRQCPLSLTPISHHYRGVLSGEPCPLGLYYNMNGCLLPLFLN